MAAQTKRLVPIIAILLLAQACASTPQGVVYQQTDLTVVTVKTAVKGFNALYQQGKFTEEDRLVVIDVYDKFRLAAKAEVAAGRLLSDTDDPTKLTGDLAVLAQKVIDAVKAIKTKRGVP